MKLQNLFFCVSLWFRASRPRHFIHGPSGTFFPRSLHTRMACMTNFPSPLPCMSTSWNLSQLCSCSSWSPTDQEWLVSRGARPHQLCLYVHESFHGGENRAMLSNLFTCKIFSMDSTDGFPEFAASEGPCLEA